ncbi:MAG: bifunctional folylpolyglutamate synthase/dihydrofolate synthase [Bacteroidales bacterium]|nr:bifunctional folylpolyglutamate synthase/dihydrofolate synthase [Bacteroidales bacterium]
MTYDETLEFLFNQLPAYHRVGAAAYKANLDNTEAMMRHLGHPERAFQAIHIAGTNGKGSVSHMLAAILHRAGLRVGLYTSPHLVDFRERIRIDGQMIDKESVVRFVEQNKPFFLEHELSFFEMTVGLAFDYFSRQQVDIAVVEVGMGGRLDSTNVVLPRLCVITNIGFDHTQFLGDTLPKIAGEKAGIIKAGVPVVIGQTQSETEPVFRQRAAAVGAPLTFADQHFEVKTVASQPDGLHVDIERDGQPYAHDVCCQLGGIYQLKNLATLCGAVEELRRQGMSIDDDAFRKGLASVISDSGLRGRWQQVDSSPTTICETAHNADGIAELLRGLSTMRYRRLHLVYGCVGDKDYGHILEMLPQDACYYYTRPSVPRGLDETVLAAAGREHGRAGETFADVMSALAAARAAADKDDLVVVTGSIFLVADLLAQIDNR